MTCAHDWTINDQNGPRSENLSLECVVCGVEAEATVTNIRELDEVNE